MKKNKLKCYLIAPITVTIILLFIYVVKGIYPFGTTTIANGDIGQSYIPLSHYLHDIIFNGKNIFYNYTLGMGSNMYGTGVLQGFFSPTTILSVLTYRENIGNIYSFLLIIRVSLIALTSYILFSKLFKDNDYYNIIFSILYALSGYVIMFNTNIMWLDIIAIFPLFILSIKYMFEKNRIYWYGIILAIILVINYNLAWMILMFIIFVIPIYIRFGLPKEKRKKATFDLIMGTILSVGLSAFAFIPGFSQAMSSYRLSGQITNSVSNSNILFKIVIFIFYSLPVYGYIKWFKYYKEDKKNFIIYGVSLIFSAIIPIIFERVNLLWHTGSYQCFPIRYGFIPIMILYLGALNYFSKYEQYEEKNTTLWKLLGKPSIVIFMLISILRIICAIYLNMSMPAFAIPYLCFAIILITCILLYIIIDIIYNMKDEKKKRIFISIVVLVEVITYTYAYVGVKEEYRYGLEWSDEQISTSYNIKDSFNISNTLYRIKDLTALTTENCALVHNIPTMTTFCLSRSSQVLNAIQLGYTNCSTKIKDYGGTILSDSVYGIRYIISREDLPEDVYKYINTTNDGIKLYEYKNSLPIGILYDNEIIDFPDNIKNFEAQNFLYQKLFDKQDDIIEKININNNVEIDKEKNVYKYSINIEGCKELYLYNNIYDEIENIKINGKILNIPLTNYKENTSYPNSYNNGILDLGTFKNEIVNIEIDSNDDKLLESLEIGIFDVEKYNNICREHEQDNIKIEVNGNHIKISGNSERNTNIFIPINYDNGWKSYNNVNVKRVYNNFIGIEIKKGENNIELKFMPELFETSVKITIVTIISMIIMFFVRKKYDIRNIKIIVNIFWILGIIIYLGCVFKVYIISILKTIF